MDLSDRSGPLFVVLRVDGDQARTALAEHLVASGAVSVRQEAGAIVANAPTRSVGVVW